MFVDGRYTIQASLESGDNFQIKDYQKIINCDLFKNLTLGIDPKLFTSSQIQNFFLKKNKVKQIPINLIDKIYRNNKLVIKPFYSLKDKIVGENHKKKLKKIISFLKRKKLDYIFISAPENVAWLLNIRGQDNPNSPIPNCHMLLDRKKNIYLLGEKKKFSKLIDEKKIHIKQIINEENFTKLIESFKKSKISIDTKSCSLFFEKIFEKNLKIIKNDDPIYLLKSMKNNIEIKNMINCHILDGIALTKFLYWMKKKKQKINY